MRKILLVKVIFFSVIIKKFVQSIRYDRLKTTFVFKELLLLIKMKAKLPLLLLT